LLQVVQGEMRFIVSINGEASQGCRDSNLGGRERFRFDLVGARFATYRNDGPEIYEWIASAFERPIRKPCPG
jgi:hypothetical protein